MKELVKVIVKVSSEQGKYCLAEIHGLKEGEEIIGEYNEANGAVDFTWGGLDAMLWVGENCEIVSTLQMEYIVADKNSLVAAAMSENFFDDLKEAKQFKAENGGHLFFGASWVDNNGEYENCVPPVYGKTERIAINKLMNE